RHRSRTSDGSAQSRPITITFAIESGGAWNASPGMPGEALLHELAKFGDQTRICLELERDGRRRSPNLLRQLHGVFGDGNQPGLFETPGDDKLVIVDRLCEPAQPREDARVLVVGE